MEGETTVRLRDHIRKITTYKCRCKTVGRRLSKVTATVTVHSSQDRIQEACFSKVPNRKAIEKSINEGSIISPYKLDQTLCPSPWRSMQVLPFSFYGIIAINTIQEQKIFIKEIVFLEQRRDGSLNSKLRKVFPKSLNISLGVNDRLTGQVEASLVLEA
ncbi:hypothetical protein BYT27DRAFT_6645559 [Phlegmacium glaucopus]|nr:hypothetical protein BYT27DRAFT_6645559 [Phlegmacium glaucopus]